MKTRESRRDFLKYMSILSIAAFYTAPAYAKTTKESVQYQPTPNNGNKCEMCTNFIPEKNECSIVEGSIDPNGWCTSFFEKIG